MPLWNQEEHIVAAKFLQDILVIQVWGNLIQFNSNLISENVSTTNNQVNQSVVSNHLTSKDILQDTHSIKVVHQAPTITKIRTK
jgi:hypothetical protein